MNDVVFEKDRQLRKAQQLVLESIASRLQKEKSFSAEKSKELVKAILESE